MDYSNKTVALRDDILLIATVLPADATDKNIIWSSSDTDIATVDANGNITTLTSGTTTITATSSDGGKKAACTFLIIVPFSDIQTVTAGSFTMGSPVSEGAREGYDTEHKVTLTEDFNIGKYEVTTLYGMMFLSGIVTT